MLGVLMLAAQVCIVLVAIKRLTVLNISSHRCHCSQGWDHVYEQSEALCDMEDDMENAQRRLEQQIEVSLSRLEHLQSNTAKHCNLRSGCSVATDNFCRLEHDGNRRDISQQCQVPDFWPQQRAMQKSSVSALLTTAMQCNEVQCTSPTHCLHACRPQHPG